jgi:hypothetical protein
MQKNKNQFENGYIAPVVLFLTIAGMAMVTLVIETGLMMQVRTQLNNGVELAVSAGAHAYGKQYKKSVSEEYENVKDEAELEAIAEAATMTPPPTPEELAEMVKEKAREKVKEKQATFQSDARARCSEAAVSILKAHTITPVTVRCTDTEVIIDGSKEYYQTFTNVFLGGSSIFREHAIEKIILTEE